MDKVILSCPLSTFESVIKILSKRFRTHNINSYVNLEDVDGNTSIIYAAYRGNIRIIQILIDYGASIDVSTINGLNILHMAAQGDNPNVIIYFKEKYKMSIYSKDLKDNTPLHWACFNCAEHSVNYLLSFMNDINQQNNLGQTALHIAIFTERIRIIKKLLKKGADLNIKDKNGKNPIQLSIQLTGASSKVTNVLIENKPMKTCFYGNGEKGKINLFINAFTFLFSLILFNLIVYKSQLSYLSPGYTGFFFIINIIYLLSLIYINSSDPGIILKKEKCDWFTLVCKNVNIKNMCPYCQVQKEKLSKHCFICNHCIEEQSNHCNLLGNCIGKNNYSYYFWFLFMSIVYSFYIYFISLKVFLINEPSLPLIDTPKLTEKDHILPFTFIFKSDWKDAISVFAMTCGLFGLGFSIFIIIKQIRQIIINKKIKNI